MQLSVPRKNAFACALAYGCLASIIVAGISFLEGSLCSERTVYYSKTALIQYPYIYNVSTVLDFAVFNPVAIYFLLRASSGFAHAFHHFNNRGAMSPFNQVGAIFVSMALGFSAMWFYFQGFVGKNFFSESFAVGPGGTAIVTFTGWAVFVFTAVFISFVLLVTIQFGNYVLFVRSLSIENFEFSLPPNVSEDIRVAARPCTHVMYVLATLFIVLSVFIFRDFYQFHIRESRRVWLFAPYIIACVVGFFPFWHLHQMMSARKADIVETNNNAIEKDISEFEYTATGSSKKIDPHKLTQAVDKIEKLQSFYKSIPVWPVTASALIIPNMSFLVSAITLFYKIADSVHAVGPR